MSWNDYYKFRYSLLPRRSDYSELPGLRGWISGWATLFVIGVAVFSHIQHPWRELSSAFVLAVPYACLLWSVAALGEFVPRVASWAVLAIAAVGGFATAVVAHEFLGESNDYANDLIVYLLFGAFSLLVAGAAARRIVALLQSSAV